MSDDDLFYWQGQEGVLYHTESGEREAVIPWFNSIEDAEQFLESQDEQNPGKEFGDFTLYRLSQSGHYRELEATEVITEQQSIFEY